MSVKKIAEIVGFELEDESKFNADEFKKYIDEKFIARENAHKDDEINQKVMGSVFGPVNSKAAKLFGLKSSEIEGKKFTEILDMGKAKIEAREKELSEKIGKSEDERVGQLQRELEAKQQALTELESSLDTTKKTYEEQINGLNGTVKNIKLTQKKREIESRIPFTDEFTKNPVLQKGFQAIVAERFTEDLDENDNLVVLDRATKKPVKHPTVASKFAGYEDVLKMVAEENKYLKKNNLAADAVTKKTLIDGENRNGRVVDVKRVHPKAVAAAERGQA